MNMEKKNGRAYRGVRAGDAMVYVSDREYRRAVAIVERAEREARYAADLREYILRALRKAQVKYKCGQEG